MRFPRRPRVPVACLTCLAVLAGALLTAGPAFAGQASKACKIIKPSRMQKVLGAPVKRDPGNESSVAGAENCAFVIGSGLLEPGGGLVVVTYYSGPIVKGIAADIKTRAEPIEKGVVFDPLVDAAYVVKKKHIVGVAITYTGDQPSVEELKPSMAELAKVGSKNA